MANDITNGVWRIDTLPFTYKGPVKVVNAIWSNIATAGDHLVVQIIDGRPIVDILAYAPDFDWSIGWLGWFPKGIQVVTMTSGVLQLVVGAGR